MNILIKYVLCFTGSALLSETVSDTLKAEMNTAVNHKFFDARVSIVEEIQMVKDINLKSSSMLDITSPLSVQVSLEHTGQVGIKIEEISGDSNFKGSFVTGPINGDATLKQSLAVFPFREEARIESSLVVNSAPLQAQNTITATYGNGELSILSNTEAFGDMLTHTAEVTFMQSRFAVKSDTKAMALGLKIQNVAEASASPRDANIKIEIIAARSEDRINAQITATVDGDGLAVNSDAFAKLSENTATHKAILTVNKNGLATSGSTSLDSPLILKNSFNGNLDSTKASLSVNTKGELVGMLLNNVISMSATTSLVDLSCKSQGTFAEELWYTNDVSVQAQPYSATVNINNNAQIFPVKMSNEAVFKAAPYVADLTGSVKLAVYSEELKHDYEIRYADLTAAAKCKTTGKLLGAHMSHDTEMEIAGLAVRFSNNANFNSQPVRLTTTLQAAAAPFSFSLNALANGDGELNLFGKQSAQVYTKVLLKAEPLAIAHSHECRLSTKHDLSSDVTIETTFDHKVDTVLTPSEQSTTLRMKSNINNNEISQDVSAYNNHERIGLEMSGVLRYTEIQDVSLSGFIKYDKNTESHVINLPFIESLPAVLENIKIAVVTMAEALQNYIKREDFVGKIETLQQAITDFVTDLNLEERAVQLKNDLIAFVQDCPIIETLEKLRSVAQKSITELSTYVRKAQKIVKEAIAKGAINVQKLTEKLNELTEKYDIRGLLIVVIETVEDVIREIDVTKLKDSKLVFLYDLDEQYAIKSALEQLVSDIKNLIREFDPTRLVEGVKSFISTINIQQYTELLMANFPTEEISKTVDKLKLLLAELDIPGKCKVIYSNMKDILVKYELDKKIEAFLDKIVELIKQFKIGQTVQVLTNALKSIPLTNMLDEALTYLKTTEVKDIIEDLNTYLNTFIQRLKSFDYNAFVDEANQKISECISKLNDLVVSLELRQKLEAVREFINYALSTVSAFFEQLRTVKISDLKKTLKDVIDYVAETLKQKISDTDIKGHMLKALEYVSDIYTNVLTAVTKAFNNISEMLRGILGDQPIFTELMQVIEGVITGLKTAELEFPSFTVPLTDLVVPSKKFSLHQLQEIELPAQIELPQFTILGYYTQPAITISCDDIKQRLIELIEFIISFEYDSLVSSAYFGELPLNYLPDFSAITLPELTFTDIYIPAIPKLSEEFIINIPLRIPEVKLPKIPSAVVVPAFGRLYGEIRLQSPIYTIRTSAEIQNSTGNEQMHHFTAFFTSVGESPKYPVLSYNLDSTARIGMPRLSRLIIAETLKFIHSALTVEHQASVTFYGLSAQATAQTTMKVNTTPYKADIANKAFLAAEGGMSFSFDTSYNHLVDIPSMSYTSKVALSQLAVGQQKGATFRLTVGQLCTNKITNPEYSDEITYKGDLLYTMDLQRIKLTYTEELNSGSLKMKETLNFEAVALSHIDFNGRLETKSPIMKNSLVVASGRAHLRDMKVELEATHDTELIGPISGTLSNALNIMVRPFEIVIDFQNKGNAKVSLEESLSAKIDLQNDYALIVNTQKQRINTAALVRFNQYKYSYNFTADNQKAESGIYAAVNGETDLEFLSVPISIPEITVPVFDFTIPAVDDFSLYEHSGLKHLLPSTKQAIDMNGKIVYQKSRFPPIIDLGLISVPAIGNLNSEVSFKSSIFSLNANAGIQGDDDFVIRIAATSTSEYESLVAKLEGTSSLTFKRGVKLATALSLENIHINGNHDSTMALNTDNLEAAVGVNTIAKVNLPILTIDAKHKLSTDTKSQLNGASTLNIKSTFDLPIIKAVGSGDFEHIFKLDGTFSFISAECKATGMIDGTVLETGIVKGTLDNEASIYINGEVQRSKLKTVSNVDVKYGALKVGFDVDENLELEAALSRVYTVLNVVSNNEVAIAALNTKGKHIAKATIDLVPVESLSAEVEFDMSQPSTFGDLTWYEKTVVDLVPSKQKISYTLEVTSPMYTTKNEIQVDAPVFKVDFKSSAKSPFMLLAYNLDSEYLL